MHINTENNPKVIELIENCYDKDEWNLFNNHPNLAGCASRSLIDIYISNKQMFNNELDILKAVVYVRKIASDVAGSLINANGNNLNDFNVEKIESLINYAEKDLTVIIYALLFTESEHFRKGISLDPSKNEMICYVIFVNVLEILKGNGMALKQSEIVEKIANFRKDWYDLYFDDFIEEDFSKNLLESINLIQSQYKSFLRPWVLFNIKSKITCNGFLSILDANKIKYEEDENSIKFNDKICFTDNLGYERNISLNVSVNKISLSQIIIEAEYNICEDFHTTFNFCESFYNSLQFLPQVTKKVVNSNECYLVNDTNTLISYYKNEENQEKTWQEGCIHLQYDLNL